jgi:hypothetical protein
VLFNQSPIRASVEPVGGKAPPQGVAWTQGAVPSMAIGETGDGPRRGGSGFLSCLQQQTGPQSMPHAQRWPLAFALAAGADATDAAGAAGAAAHARLNATSSAAVLDHRHGRKAR